MTTAEILMAAALCGAVEVCKMKEHGKSGVTACVSHCYHPHGGPLWMVLKQDHILLKCCNCGTTNQVHIAHAAEACK